MKFKILFIAFLFTLLSFGQATLPVNRTSDWNSATVTGWSHTGTTDRTTAFACTGSNAETFDNTGDRIVLNFSTAPDQLIFKLKSASMSGASSLFVEESVDGTTYTALGTYGTASGATTITDCADITLTLNATTRYVRWTYTKATGNVDIDDVIVTAGATCISPSTQASLFTSSLVTSTTATIGLTRGNGNRVLIIGRAGSAVNQDPASGTSYTASTVFGSGTQIGTGNFVVYDGVASPTVSVALTNLVGSTTYHFAAYEYNTIATCYNLVELTGSFTTPAATPVAVIANNGTQVTAAFVDQGTTAHILHKFQIGVTAANTTLAGMTMTTTGNYTASDVVNFKVRYSADNVLDVADVTLATETSIASGSGESVTFSPFTSQIINAGTTGYVFITADFSATAVVNNTISVNAIATTNLVFTSTPATTKSGTTTVGGVQTIRPSAPAVPTNFTKGCSSNTTQQLSWSAPLTGTFDGYMLVVREGGLAPHAVTAINASTSSPNLDYTVAPTFGSTVPLSKILYVGTGTSITVTGLTQGISYYYELYAYKNNGASASVYSTATSTTQIAGLSNVINPSTTALTSAASVNWSNPNVGCYDEILVVVTTASGITFSPTGDGTAYSANSVYTAPNQVVYQNNGSFFTITGLTNGVTYYVEIFVRQGTQWSTGVEVSVIPNASTIFKPGELMFVAFDGQINGSGANDQYMIATMVDILPGTKFSLVNSRYEAGAAANVRTDKWGGSGDFAEDAPGVVEITYNGPGNISAGSVLVLTTDGTASVFSYVGVITGTTETDRTTSFSHFLPFGGATSAPNISSSGSDQIYLVQGSFAYDGTYDLLQANYFLNGTLLHGLTNRAAWVPLTSSCNGSAAGGNTRESRLPVALTCFNLESSSTSSVSGYYENDKEHGSAPLRDIILGISNQSNWTFGGGRYTKDPTSSLVTRAGKTFIIGTGSAATGQWIGDINNDWFNCANWGRLTVPDETIDVIIDTFGSFTNNASISISSPYAIDYNSQAKCNNIAINNRRLVIEGNTLNKLEVFGNLSITSGGIVDMDDSTAATDGQIDLYGNWTNSVGLAAFLEGNGKVNFVGAVDQIINNNVHTNPEEFFNVELDNNFDTSLSNNLIAKGNLQVNTGNSVYIRGNDYVQVNEDLTNNGVLEIDNNGILYQVDDTGINTGNIIMRRGASIRELDYVFWSSPIDEFTVSNISTGTPSDVIWKWNPRASNPNGAFGNWINCASDLMEKGKGYIVRGPNGYSNVTPATFTATFQNAIANKAKPNNGIINQRLYRGPMQVANLGTYTSANTVAFSVNDDNWNLVGNPYPSAISVNSFLTYNAVTVPVIEGSVRIWSHTNLPVSSVNPFYNSYQYNYVSSDYITHNGTATISGPTAFDGFIGAGQGFFVLMNDGPETLDADAPINLVFNNSMRVKTTNSNSQFFKMSNSVVTDSEDKHRIWLDLVNDSGSVVRTVVGYVPNATFEKDVMYDAFARIDGTQNFYSVIGDARVCIQGRPVPFENSDIVPLGVAIPTSGNYTIAIAFVDGLFSDINQNIYLEDKLLNVIHNLRTAPYIFNSTTGVFNDRFVLRYTNTSLGNDEFDASHNIVVTTQSQNVTIKSDTQMMASVIIYDLLGRELVNKNKIDNNEIVLSNINAKNQALIVKIILENGQVVTRKITL